MCIFKYLTKLNLSSYVLIHVQEFMRGGAALDDLISDVLEHAEREALLEKVESSSSLRRSADWRPTQVPVRWTEHHALCGLVSQTHFIVLWLHTRTEYLFIAIYACAVVILQRTPHTSNHHLWLRLYFCNKNMKLCILCYANFLINAPYLQIIFMYKSIYYYYYKNIIV